MMDGYIFGYREKIIGGIYEPPYFGAKPMLPVMILDNRELLQEMVRTMEPELPERVKKDRQIFSTCQVYVIIKHKRG